MFERLSQVILIVLGALALAVLVMGLAVSCREVPDPNELPPSVTPGGLPLTPVPSGASPTPTPLSLPANPTATPTPSPLSATATPTPGQVVVPPGGATATPPAGATLPPPGGLTPGTTIQHTVIRGEWLLQIARCYGTAYGGVWAANRLPNPDLIYPGQVITVPNIGSLGRIIGPPCVQAHPVEAGETWESMATRFGTTTAILRRANPGELSLGRIIWAPRP
jgi:LysM repeat protein